MIWHELHSWFQKFSVCFPTTPTPTTLPSINHNLRGIFSTVNIRFWGEIETPWNYVLPFRLNTEYWALRKCLPENTRFRLSESCQFLWCSGFHISNCVVEYEVSASGICKFIWITEYLQGLTNPMLFAPNTPQTSQYE